MEQYIKIKALNDEKNLGTFTIYIDNKYPTTELYDYLNENNVLNKEFVPEFNDSITLYNVPIVDEFDNKTPIQYYNVNDFSMANILLLEENEYQLSKYQF